MNQGIPQIQSAFSMATAATRRNGITHVQKRGLPLPTGAGDVAPASTNIDQMQVSCARVRALDVE